MTQLVVKLASFNAGSARLHPAVIIAHILRFTHRPLLMTCGGAVIGNTYKANTNDALLSQNKAK